jgi:magnesium chelatase family protein
MKIYSSSSVETDSFIETKQRPYRSPHHTISASALLGGGCGTLWPGEISLAHHGVLFLDEFPEFRRDSIEGLREPLQSGVFHLNRIGKSASFPARMTLIAAMNPCPCGMLSIRDNRCRCSPEKKAQYRKKLSTPILDRLGLMVNMSDKNLELESSRDISFAEVRGSIESAFDKQAHRYKHLPGIFGNGMVANCRNLEAFDLDNKTEDWLKVKQKECSLSLRRIGQIINVARTIADIEEKEVIGFEHVLEAWGLRCFDFYQPN